jgi:hypothetical protein
MFIENKYTKYYLNIITSAISRVQQGYSEQHHIIPASMGGSDHPDNLVRLTAKEHFVCHLLLTRMVDGPNRHKAIKAARMMAKTAGPGQKRYKVTGKIYEILTKNKIAVSESTRIKMGISQKQRFEKTSGTFKNKKHTEETLEKLRKPKSQEQKQKQSQKMKGRFKGKLPHNKGKTFEELYGSERAIEIKEKIRHVGEKNGFYGKTHSAEQREKKRQEKLAAPKKLCYHCSKEVDPMNYARWHGDNCKQQK